MPTFYDDTNMHNASNGGGGPGQPIPQVVQPNRVEEAGTLVPQTALDAVLAQATQFAWLKQPAQLFDGPKIFMSAPQY